MTSASELLAQVDPPSADQLRMARMVLNGLTDVQRRAVYAVVVWEAVLEVRGEQ